MYQKPSDGAAELRCGSLQRSLDPIAGFRRRVGSSDWEGRRKGKRDKKEEGRGMKERRGSAQIYNPSEGWDTRD